MMNAKTRNRYEARARIMKALAHPTRLFIIDQLGDAERCVYEMTEMIGSDVSTVSKHLSVLKDAGIVADDKRGNQVFYSLRVPCVLKWYSCVEGVLEADVRQRLAAIK
ncbi:MAG: ArsR family transcriptional regulator [Gemmatimonas sp. SG8_17]|nr:MAG: ArsR family transcriptional regulator [Gemmatimonas sp. SG8_17]